jgi:general secretion pathway protein G
VSKHTLIELLVVLSIISLLMSLAVPRYFNRIDTAKEAVLHDDLHQMRDAIDKFYGDHNHYPDTLDDLVTRKYLRTIPPDPMTDSAKTWVTVAPDDPSKGNIYDVKSGAEGKGKNGTDYNTW